jgi:hypothetical protein
MVGHNNDFSTTMPMFFTYDGNGNDVVAYKGFVKKVISSNTYKILNFGYVFPATYSFVNDTNLTTNCATIISPFHNREDITYVYPD